MLRTLKAVVGLALASRARNETGDDASNLLFLRGMAVQNQVWARCVENRQQPLFDHVHYVADRRGVRLLLGAVCLAAFKVYLWPRDIPHGDGMELIVTLGDKQEETMAYVCPVNTVQDVIPDNFDTVYVNINRVRVA